MVFDKIQSLCPNHLCCRSRKQHKEPFLFSHVTICLGTNMADSNRRHDKSHVGENQESPFYNPHSTILISQSLFFNPHSTIPILQPHSTILILQSPFHNPYSKIPIPQSLFYNPHSTILILLFLLLVTSDKLQQKTLGIAIFQACGECAIV